MTRDIDEKEAQWKIAQLAKTIAMIEKEGPQLRKIIESVESSAFLSSQDRWNNILHLQATAHNIMISKPPERIDDMDDLTGKEIVARSIHRSCSDPLCHKSHCSECGLHRARLGDGHVCV